MPDQITRTTSTSWFSRVGGAFAGVLFGIVLILGSIVGLSWNEGRAIKTIRGLNEGAEAVVDIQPAPIVAGNDQQLVHVSGPVVVTEPLVDEAYGVSATGVRLVRSVQMYQWAETSKSESRTKLGGGEETVTTYSYARQWSGSGVDSSGFEDPAGHENPSFDIEGASITAQDATLGDFKLDDGVIDNIGGATAVPIRADQQAAIEAAAGDDRYVRIAQNYIYLNQSDRTQAVPDAPAPAVDETDAAAPAATPEPASVQTVRNGPEVGDVRISYEVTPAAEISVVARQNGDGFAAYRASNGEEMLLVDDGNVPAAEMFADAQAGNRMLTWIVRVIGMVLLMVGFSLVFAPLGVLGDVVPLFGSIIRMGTGLVGFVLAMVVGSITIALSWLAFRPLVAIAVLAVGGLIGFLVYRFGRKRAKGRAAAAAPA